VNCLIVLMSLLFVRSYVPRNILFYFVISYSVPFTIYMLIIIEKYQQVGSEK